MERENGEVTRLTVVVAYSSIEAIADGVVDDPPKTQKKESSRTIKRLCSQFAGYRKTESERNQRHKTRAAKLQRRRGRPRKRDSIF